MDPELRTLLEPLMAAAAELPAPAVGDVATRRERAVPFFALLAAGREPAVGVEVTGHVLATADGAELPLNWYAPTGSEPTGAAALYLHGGGMIYSLAETAAMYDSAVRGYVAASGVPMLTVDYRVAPEHSHPTPVEDCYAALCWLAEHAAGLGVDPARLAVAGSSAGAALAAGLAQRCAEGELPPIVGVLLHQPVLDDRPTASKAEFATTPGFDGAAAQLMWRHYLGDTAPDAASVPARNHRLIDTPTTFITCSELDPLRDEAVDYARGLMRCGVRTDLHVFGGTCHGFDSLRPEWAVSRALFTMQCAALGRFFA